MSQPLIILTGLIYAFISIEQGARGNPGVALMFAGYAFANIGIYMQAA